MVDQGKLSVDLDMQDRTVQVNMSNKQSSTEEQNGTAAPASQPAKYRDPDSFWSAFFISLVLNIIWFSINPGMCQVPLVVNGVAIILLLRADHTRKAGGVMIGASLSWLVYGIILGSVRMAAGYRRHYLLTTSTNHDSSKSRFH